MMNRFIFFGIILSVFLLLSSCGTGTPLEEYQPKDQAEKELTETLLRHKEARIAGDLNKILSSFHDNCQINLFPYASLNKRQLADVETDDWTFDGELQLFDPEFEIQNNTAIVSLKLKLGVAGSRLNIFTLVKESNGWLISKLVLVDL